MAHDLLTGTLDERDIADESRPDPVRMARVLGRDRLRRIIDRQT
jgi:hypothetical protein